MEKSYLGITDTGRAWRKEQLNSVETLPEDSLFQDDIFKKTCRKLQDRNVARAIQDVTQLIVRSAETLAIYGAGHLEHLGHSRASSMHQ
jgi:hypothetical protein